jgi:N-methylhydantoinase A/oxoprolinase/acetone carboxylase beta subunit
MRVGIDAGGTFIDCITSDGRILKQKSTPTQPQQSIMSALSVLDLRAVGVVVCHGTTVATNLILERKGARTAVVTTQGFADVIEIRRQNRPRIYDLNGRWPEPLVPRELRFEVDERVGPDGVIRPLTDLECEKVWSYVAAAEVESIAVAMLHSFQFADHERQFAEARPPDLPVSISLSSEILPEIGEYERTSAAVLNAYVAPGMHAYLEQLAQWLENEFQHGPSTFFLMSSSGGMVDSATAQRLPILTLLSGPAAGCLAAKEFGKAAGFNNLITMDVGGTSTDIALIPGELLRARAAQIGGFAIGLPTIDIETIGAGGGSIVRSDTAGLIHVGPDSAGADPGPACYSSGGPLTLTDVNLILGRIPASLVGATLDLDRTASLAAAEAVALTAEMAIEQLCWTALRVAESNIHRAMRRVVFERGYDPRDFTLVAFGGAGPQLACEVADDMGVSSVLIPPYPGVMAAAGLLGASIVRNYTVSLHEDLDEPNPAQQAHLDRRFEELREQALSDLQVYGSVAIQQSLELRFRGQTYTLEVAAGNDLLRRFHTAYAERYGVTVPDQPVEIVRLLVSGAVAPGPAELPSGTHHPYSVPATIRISYFGRGGVWKGHPTTICSPEELGTEAGSGPLIVEQYDTTIVIPPRWEARALSAGGLVLTRQPEV